MMIFGSAMDFSAGLEPRTTRFMWKSRLPRRVGGAPRRLLLKRVARLGHGCRITCCNWSSAPHPPWNLADIRSPLTPGATKIKGDSAIHILSLPMNAWHCLRGALAQSGPGERGRETGFQFYLHDPT